MTNLVPRLEFLAQALVRSTHACPHCGSLDTTRIARKYALVGVRRCAPCGLAFTDPVYESWLLGGLYGGRYAAEGSTTSPPEPARLRALIAEDFRGTDKHAGPQLERLRELVPAPGARLLEVGASWGYFLAQARAAGFETHGVEVDPRRAAYARDELDQEIWASLDEAAAAGPFDLIYSAHTLEHFTDLGGVLEELASLLAEDGLLAIEVPNFDLETLGPAALSTVGAVHPLGFDGPFFWRNLDDAGFGHVAVHECWSDVGVRTVERSKTDVVIATARRRGAVEPQRLTGSSDRPRAAG